jgi:Prenyltransferase and squalene oxidase repeat
MLLSAPRLICLGILLLVAAAPAAEKTAPLPSPTPAQLEKSIDRGVAYLVKKQNKDGSWGSATRTKDLNIFAPVPGSHQAFRAATTALGISALIETGAADTDSAARQSLERAEAWLLKNLGGVRRADGVAIYNVWAHGYGIHALVQMLRRAPQDAARHQAITNLIYQQIDRLRRYESVDGGWGYYDFRAQTKRPSSDATSFTTATVLIAFHEAQEAGIKIPEDVRKRAFDSIVRQTKKDFSYDYGEYLKLRPMLPINRPGGSLGRSQACNLTLRLWGYTNITDAVMIEWLDRLVARNGWLDIGRKRPVPHESWFQVAGYFFYYGHYYAALVVEHLGPEKAGRFQGPLAAIITSLQEKDGSWFDFPFYDYHQPYGTAFALMTLARCRPGGP